MKFCQFPSRTCYQIFLYLLPIFSCWNIQSLKLKGLNFREITLNLNRVPPRSFAISFAIVESFVRIFYRDETFPSCSAALFSNFTKVTAYLTSTPLFSSSIFDVSLTLESLIMP